MVGQRVSHYEILSVIGAGGMGEVYKARDTRLHRSVALKFLHADPSLDVNPRRRLLNEAQAASALNHPHIVAIHDVGSADGRDFIVMEFVAGQPLGELIGPSGLKLAQVLRYSIQIADAMASAHAAGIVHRDLKPANIMVSDSGQVKVLDFGLAKSTAVVPAAAKATSSLRPPTIAGSIVGTIAYMSPEQAEGKPIDRRSDVFSFGVMLYEMTTGERPFTGETPLAILSAILHLEPRPVTELAPATPRELVRIIARCLKKDIAARCQHMDDVRISLLDVQEQAALGAVAVPPVQPSARVARPLSIAAAALLVGLALGAAGWWAITRPQPDSSPGPAAVPVFRRLTSDAGLTTQPALSQDGKFVAYASDRATADNLDIWVQQVDGGSAIRLTEDPSDDHEPDFSPDGSKIAFRSDRDGGGIYVVATLGGAPRSLVKGGHFPRYSPNGAWIAFWSGEPTSGILYQAGEARMMLVSADGGVPQPLRPDFSLAFPPVWTPDGDHLVFWGFRQPGDAFDWWVSPIAGGEATKTGVADLAGAEPPDLTASMGPDYRLVFSTEQTVKVGGHSGSERSSLRAVRLDPKNWRPSLRVESLTLGTGRDASPSVSRDGTVAFHSGAYTMDLWSLPVNASRATVLGPAVPLTSDQALDYRPFISDDGRHLVFVAERFGNRDLLAKDISTGAEWVLSATRLPEVAAVLSPDNTRVAYAVRGPALNPDVFLVPWGGGVPTPVCTDCGEPFDWTPDGRSLLLVGRLEDERNAVKILELGQGVVGTVRHSRANLFEPQVAPDGRWLAMSVNLGEGRSRVWLAPFSGRSAGPESAWMPVTEEIGFAGKVRFSPDGGWLYYYSTRDGFGCVYAQRLDRASGLPTEPPVDIMHFHRSRRSLANAFLGPLEIGVARDKVIFNMAEVTGNIWLRAPESRSVRR